MKVFICAASWYAYDRRILALLQEDASLSSAQIAEQVGLSPIAVLAAYPTA